MINKITVKNYLGEKMEMILREPEKSGFLIYSVTGLGPVKASINTTEVTTNDGSLFNSARLDERNIVIGILFDDDNGNYTIEDLRHKSYKYFPIKKYLELIIETDTRKVKTFGYVESNDPSIFSDKEGTQISIICPDSYFYSLDDSNTITIFSGEEPLFEFPFSNESLINKTIEFGRLNLVSEANIFYNGDANIGVTMYIHAIGIVGDITIYNTGTREFMIIYVSKIQELTGKPFDAGDDIIISTIKGNKFIKLLRNGKYTNIINSIDKKSSWFQLAKGDNLFAYTAVSGSNNARFRIENSTIYEGI